MGGIFALLVVFLVMAALGTGFLLGRSNPPGDSEAQPLVEVTPTRHQVVSNLVATPLAGDMENPVPITTSTPSTDPGNSDSDSPDFESLKALMLNLINEDRATEGLRPVTWDSFTAQVAQAHAVEMAREGYMSHWNLQGEGPDIRYGRAGGTEVVQENVYMYWWRYEDGSPAPIEDWEAVVREAQQALMESPGHRANIMSPEHTHVGIGIDYNADTGDVRIAQEFINRYIVMGPLPQQVQVGQTVQVYGQLFPGTESPLINLAYEPFPAAMTIAEAESRHTYESPAEFFEAIALETDNQGNFFQEIMLNYEGRAGIYHLRIWVETEAYGTVQAVNAIVEVTE